MFLHASRKEMFLHFILAKQFSSKSPLQKISRLVVSNCYIFVHDNIYGNSQDHGSLMKLPSANLVQSKP